MGARRAADLREHRCADPTGSYAPPIFPGGHHAGESDPGPLTALHATTITARRTRPLAALLAAATIALAGCAGGDAVDAVADDLEVQLANEIVPLLASNGATEETLNSFAATVRSVRTPDLHVVRASYTVSSDGDGATAAYIESTVTVVGGDSGACLVVFVDAEGEVKTLEVDGYPAENCGSARPPSDW